MKWAMCRDFTEGMSVHVHAHSVLTLVERSYFEVNVQGTVLMLRESQGKIDL